MFASPKELTENDLTEYKRFTRNRVTQSVHAGKVQGPAFALTRSLGAFLEIPLGNQLF